MQEEQALAGFIDEWRYGWHNRDKTIEEANKKSMIRQLINLIETRGYTRHGPGPAKQKSGKK